MKSLVLPVVKIRTFLLWFGPFLFLPFLSPLILLAVPLILERFLSDSPNHWGAGFHYSAPLAPILAMSAADGLRRLLDKISSEVTRNRIATWATCTMLLVCSILPGKLPVWRLFSVRYYQTSDFERTGRNLIAQIPQEASVIAQDSLVPHLSQRHEIYTLRPGAPDAEFVLASRRMRFWPNASWAEIEILLEQRRQNGYQFLFQDNDWILMKKSNASDSN